MAEVPGALLSWYDRHAREMPWRIGPAARLAGAQPDPYRVWLSEVMLQQTTVAAVRGYFQRFTARWPTVEALAAAPAEDVMAEWAGLGYYARARNLLKCAREVAARGGFPDTRAGLLALPGIGPYTAAALAAIAFDRAETVMDGNVERVIARLHAVEEPLPQSKPCLLALATALTPALRPGDHAQAMMDLGATICTPQSPACGICPLAGACRARALGLAQALPRRLAKPARPVRRGYVYLARRADGAWLLETRPDSGLLGGMLAFPSSDWSAEPLDLPPLAARWRDPGLEVRHTFTHFHLRLALRLAEPDAGASAIKGAFVPPDAFRPGALPTLMRKAFDLGRQHFPGDAPPSRAD